MKDPVCGMEIEPEKAKVSMSFNGQKVWFCSESCANQFTKNPEKYAGKEAAPAAKNDSKKIQTARRKAVPSATTGVDDRSAGIRRIELPVAGLTCTKCVEKLEHALKNVPGVKKATVNLRRRRTFVDYDPAATTVSMLREAIKAAGYRTETSKTRFKIEGITCASCVTKIENALCDTAGVLSANVSIGTEEAVVEYLPTVADVGAINGAVASAGYKVVEAPAPASQTEADKEAEKREREYKSLMRKWWFGAAVGTFTMIMSYPWLFPILRDSFPRESHSLWYVWAFMGVASLAVILYSGGGRR